MTEEEDILEISFGDFICPDFSKRSIPKNISTDKKRRGKKGLKKVRMPDKSKKIPRSRKTRVGRWYE